VKGPLLPAAAEPTLDRALQAAATGSAGLIFLALDGSEERLPWRNVLARSRRTAAGLAAAGVTPGDRVALLLPTAPTFVDAFFGALLAGAIPVPLYPPVRLGRIPEFVAATSRMIRSVSARLVVTDARVKRLLGQVADRTRPPLGFVTEADLDAEAPAPPVSAASPADLALIQFSSGTTRDPQPVALSHGNVVAQCAALKAVIAPPDDAPQLGVSWLPLYHDMGLIGNLLAAVTYPGSLVLIRPEYFLARPAIWLQAISRYRATISAAPAFAFPFCAQRIKDADLAGCDLASWRLAICGAEPVSARGLERFARRFAPQGFDPRAFLPAYGLAEASLAVTSRPPGTGFTTLDVDAAHLARNDEAIAGGLPLVSSGVPLAGMEVEIRDGAGRPLDEHRRGRIHVRGPTVMAGYFDLPLATADALHDGWLDTGDLGFVAGSELYVHGRAKDLIVIRGANHPPDEFEACLDGLDGVRAGRSVAAGFVPPDGDVEELLLLVERGVGRQGGGERKRDDLEREIRRVVRQRTGIEPHTVRVVEPGALPRTSSGKLRRGETLARYLAGELAPPAATHPLALAGHVLRSALGFARARLAR